MGAGIGEHLPEDFALDALAGGFGDAEQLDDAAADTIRVPVERVHLHVETEPLALLLAA